MLKNLGFATIFSAHVVSFVNLRIGLPDVPIGSLDCIEYSYKIAAVDETCCRVSNTSHARAGGDDTKCADLGLFSGERGTWQTFDKTCLPYWGSFKDDGCKSKGFRQYSSVLWDIPNGQSWENWCKYFPADIKGVGSYMQHFYKPDR